MSFLLSLQLHCALWRKSENRVEFLALASWCRYCKVLILWALDGNISWKMEIWLSHLTCALMILPGRDWQKDAFLHGTKTSAVLNLVLSDIYHQKRDNAVKYTKKNDSIQPFESGGESSLEFFSLKTDCSLIVVSEISHMLYSLSFGCLVWRINCFPCIFCNNSWCGLE